MRVRIIFRGLTLFTFRNGSTANVEDGTDMGELTAWLISDPQMAGHALHEHIPRLRSLGRETHLGKGRLKLHRGVPDELTLTLVGPGAPQGGVRVAQSFLDFVPRLNALHWTHPTMPQIVGELERQFALDKGFVTKKIIIPSGRIRAREFISWDFHGNTPTRVAFMDTPFQGYGANEVVVDIGDDEHHARTDRERHLRMDHGKTRNRLWPFTKGSEVNEDIEPNMVEVLFTNNAARRGLSVFWGLHMMSLFDAAGYPRRKAYVDTAQFDAFEKAALDYDANEWPMDKGMMGIGQPFPFLVFDSDHDKLEAIHSNKPYIIPGKPPRPTGQRVAGAEGHAHDPVNITICPLGRE